MTARREFTTATKVAAKKRAGKFCEGCGGQLKPGRFHFDHGRADGLGGEPTLENCVVLCLPCHDEKTRTFDVPAIAKAKRREARDLGIKKPTSRPIFGSKASGWRTPFNRRPERRA